MPMRKDCTACTGEEKRKAQDGYAGLCKVCFRLQFPVDHKKKLGKRRLVDAQFRLQFPADHKEKLGKRRLVDAQKRAVQKVPKSLVSIDRRPKEDRMSLQGVEVLADEVPSDRRRVSAHRDARKALKVTEGRLKATQKAVKDVVKRVKVVRKLVKGA